MKPKAVVKLSIDLAMTVLLLCQMAYMLIGEAEHEWLGTAMFMLFLVHTFLNWRWYFNLVKGKYTVLRIVQTTVNFLILLCMAGLMASGIIMSREVFAWVPIRSGMAFARILHLLTSYWGFILMSVHLGLHWSMVMGCMRALVNMLTLTRRRTWVLRTVAALICGAGVYSFIKSNIFDYLFHKNQFVFFDFEQPLALFFTEYIAIMGLWICVAHCARRGMQQLKTSIPNKRLSTDRS